MSSSQNIYDNEMFFEGYRKLRENPLSANEMEEKPALYSLCPDLAGKSVLDLGCGYGEHCEEFKMRGAAEIVGVDISEKMLAVATAEHPDIRFIRGDMSDLTFINGKFDAVFSSLAVHYIEDFPKLVREIYALLNSGGYFIFSQENPLTTARIGGHEWERDENGNVLHMKLSDYGRPGKREIRWIVDGVIKYHRTFSDVVNALADAGFVIEKMLEPVPTAEHIRLDPRKEKDFHKPNFLLVKAKKY